MDREQDFWFMKLRANNMVKLSSKLKCPHCSKKIDGATSVNGEKVELNEGDCSICFHCEKFVIYRNNVF